MSLSIRDRLERLLASGKDNALLRFSLGSAWLKAGEPATAAAHLERALEHDPGYSAAWKLYAKALADSGRRDAAIAAYGRGIDVAAAKGDKQAAKEMQVLLRRLEKGAAGESRSV
ncbi:MAG: tetratricopeptide repeat protein [Burkholderiales bacterium]|nr:tetratricopeptide repeat protein [Burkholderiales bacterium]